VFGLLFLLILLKGQPFKDRKATIVVLTLSSHNFPTDRTRELFKPCKEAEDLQGSI